MALEIMQLHAASQATSSNVTVSDKFADMVTRWQKLDETKVEIEKVLLATSVDQMTLQAQAQLTKIEHDVECEQLKILQKALEIPAESLPEILSKMNIWRLIVCPEGYNKDFLQPTDELISSVLEDLRTLSSSNEVA